LKGRKKERKKIVGTETLAFLLISLIKENTFHQINQVIVMSSGSGNSKEKEKARVSRTSLILWHAHQNDAAAVRKLLQEDPSLVNATDYDNRTPLHVASLHGWIDVANCLLEFGADVNAQDRWKNTVRNP